MKILIVEDSKTDREILKYLLEDRFQKEAKFREASSLETATKYLLMGDIDCVLLDLQLPDSVGKETFFKLAKSFPQVPIIVLTNNKDRDLALEMIQHGAADFVTKRFTDPEEMFRRVLFAIEKHKSSVRMPPEGATSIRRLEAAQAKMLTAHQSGEHQAVQTSVVEVTNSIADLSRKMFTEMQTIHTSMRQQASNQEHVGGVVDKLHTELLEGYTDRPSLKSQVEIVTKRVSSLEDHFEVKRNTQFEILPKVKKPSQATLRLAVVGALGIAVGLLVATLL